MLGDKALELIKELDRSRGTLLPFDDDRVRLVFEEMRHLCEHMSTLLNSTSSEGDATVLLPEVKLESAGLERNQRCLLAYLWNRMQLIRQMRWEFGSILPPDIKENLSESEIRWSNNYSKSLAKYMKSLGTQGLNLTQDIKPPKSLYVEVRSLMDYGKLELEDGEVIVLTKNSQHLMPRSLSEPLIRQGILEQITS